MLNKSVIKLVDDRMGWTATIVDAQMAWHKKKTFLSYEWSTKKIETKLLNLMHTSSKDLVDWSKNLNLNLNLELKSPDLKHKTVILKIF